MVPEFPMTPHVLIGGTRIQTASDLHVDFWQSAGQPIPFTPDPTADVLVLAGDLCNGLDRGALAWLLDLAETPLWPQGIFVVLGNHDHYGLRLESASEAWLWLESACPRLHVLDQFRAPRVLRLRDGRSLRIAGCTLWSDFQRGNPLVMLSWRTAPDCRWIQAGAAGRPAAPEDFLAAHQADRAWLENVEPGSDASPLLIVTHHAPSRRSVDPRYPGSSAAFVSDLDDLVLQLNPVAWVHGHTHVIHDYRIGATRVLARPVGYPGETVGPGCLEPTEDGVALARE